MMFIKENEKLTILNKLQQSKYVIVSIALHVFVVLLFICPHFFFKEERKFISNNTQIAVHLLIQEHQKKVEDHKKEKLEKDALLQKKSDNTSEQKQEQLNSQESIVANQYVANIKYDILKSKEPSYPESVKRLNLSQDIIIKTRLLIDKEGNITKIEFLESNIDNSLEEFFKKEILSSLSTWQFSPVTIDNKPVSLYFYKNFVFKNR